ASRGRRAAGSAAPASRQQRATSHSNLGVLFRDLGKGAEAEKQFRQALAIRQKLAADFPSASAHRQGLAESHYSLGLVLNEPGKREQAQEQLRKALAIR